MLLNLQILKKKLIKYFDIISYFDILVFLL